MGFVGDDEEAERDRDRGNAAAELTLLAAMPIRRTTQRHRNILLTGHTGYSDLH
jgi:hypothetical protein